MTSPALEIQGLLVSTLKANAAVMALVTDVHDTVPTNPWGTKLAYISLGPSDIVTDDVDCIDGEEHSVQLDVWSRKVGQVECKKICDAVKRALHEQELELTDNALIEIRVPNYLVMRDPDGLTIHGVVRVSLMVEAR